MEFKSRTNYPATIPMPQCSKIQPTFELKIDKETGKKELKKSGSTNIYEKIQAAKESTLIYNIIERYKQGYEEVLTKTKGIYADITQMPTSLAEAQQRLIDAENYFNKMPLELRKEFNNSYTEFLASINNGNIEKIAKKYAKVEEKENELKGTSQILGKIEPTAAESIGGNN